MKKKKLNLEEIKVKSFVTEFRDEDGETVKGGTATPLYISIGLSCWGVNGCGGKEMDGDEGHISDVVAEINGYPPACLLDPIIVNG